MDKNLHSVNGEEQRNLIPTLTVMKAFQNRQPLLCGSDKQELWLPQCS